jgi:4-hydroxy-tetrahydrodipicolinate reductase
MGHATAEAVVRAGLELVPYTFTGFSAGVAVHNIGISGIPVEVVGPDKRQQMLDSIREKFPRLMMIDFTLPHTVAGEAACAVDAYIAWMFH